MRRALGLRADRINPRRSRLRALLKPQQLGFDTVKLAGHFQHGLVLLGHVALQPCEALF